MLAARVPVEEPKPPPILPVPPPAPDRAGGGGTTVGFPRYGADERDRLVPSVTPEEDGGATTFASSVAPEPVRFPRGLPVASSEVAAEGGATTFVGNDGAGLPVLVFDTVAGGGATTSAGPKIRPIRVLTNDPLLVAVGGGGTTVFT